MTDRHKAKPESDEAEKPAIQDAGQMTVVLLEKPDGTTESAEVPYPPHSQTINVEGVTYVHTGEDGDNWIYRPL